MPRTARARLDLSWHDECTGRTRFSSRSTLNQTSTNGWTGFSSASVPSRFAHHARKDSMKLQDLIVSDLMTRNAVSVRTTETLGDAAKRMWDNDCGIIPVLDGDSRRVVGVITDRDICMATWSRNLAPSAIVAREAMSRDPVYCAPDDSLLAAEGTMRASRVRRLPVLDSASNLVGILSVTDITRVAGQRSAVRPGFEVSPEQVVDTLTMITTAQQPPRVNEW